MNQTPSYVEPRFPRVRSLIFLFRVRLKLGVKPSAGKNMGWKLQAVVAVLLTVTVFLPFGVYASIQRYDAWKQAQLQRLPPEVTRYVDFGPMGTETTLLLAVVGPILACCWILLVAKHGRKLGRGKQST